MAADSTAPVILVISEQHMMRWGNQVLYHFLKTLLQSNFRVIWVSWENGDPNVADPREMLPFAGDRLEIHRFVPPSYRISRIVGKIIRKRPRTSAVPVATPQSSLPPVEASIPFHAQGKLQQLAWFLSFSAGAWAASRRLIRGRDIDVVCGYEVYGAPVGDWIARSRGVPFVTKYQGTFLASVPANRMWRDLPVDAVGTRPRADVIFMLNDGTRGKEALLSLGVPPERIRFDLSGVEKPESRFGPGDRTELLARHGISHTPETRILLTLSKLSHWKRVDRAIAVMPEILRRWPQTYLLVAHRGPLESALRELASSLGIADKVVFLGPLTPGTVREYLNACDFYVTLHDHSNLAIPVLEAQVAGRPVVTLNDGSTNGVITDGVNGLLINRDTIREELPRRVAQCFADRCLLSSMSENSLRCAERNIKTWEQATGEQVAEIEMLVRRRRERRTT
jgi:glycosyltransferase involved in cell wall biosynthesis